MTDLSWRIDEEARDDEALLGAPRPLLSTWHFLRSALRRGWRVWAGAAALGALTGTVAFALIPPTTSATATLLMAHPTTLDPQSAMATDVSLLTTRQVAGRTVRALGVDLTPSAFEAGVSVQPVTNEILTVTVTASSAEEARRWANTLAREYLPFRAEQLRSLSSGVVSGYERRIATAQKQVDQLGREYSRAMLEGNQDRASDLLTRRTGLNAQIVSMRQGIDDASLATEAAVTSTHVIDTAVPSVPSHLKALVLDVSSGLIAGLALGAGLVLLRALTSDRVRRRQDVALALDVPVRVSVPSLGPADKWPRLRLRRRWRHHDLELLSRGLVSAAAPGLTSQDARQVGLASSSRPWRRVAVAAVGNSRAAAEIVLTAAEHLRLRGLAVRLVDLSGAALLARADPDVTRPAGVPEVAVGPFEPPSGAQLSRPGNDEQHPELETSDIVIVLTDVDPGMDAENLGTWASVLVPVVTAGRSSSELLRTTAGLVHAAQLEMPFALMLGADTTDESLGLLPQDAVDHA